MGRITRPHGVRGEVAMKTLTDYPERLAQADTLYVGPAYVPHKVKRVRPHQTGVIIRFSGVPDRNAAELLREQLVYVHIDDAIPLEEGEYYFYQLDGIQVVTDEGQELGHFSGYIETGANDVYIVKAPDGSEVLLPAIPEVIVEVDIAARVMTVHLLDGLI